LTIPARDLEYGMIRLSAPRAEDWRGFVREGVQRARVRLGGRGHDLVWFGLPARGKH
jgi:hypothetical protein